MWTTRARIDGASELRMTSIAVPLVKPAVATVALITFIGSSPSSKGS